MLVSVINILVSPLVLRFIECPVNRSTSRVPHEVEVEGECEIRSLDFHVLVYAHCAHPQLFKFKRSIELGKENAQAVLHASGALVN